MLHHTYVAHTFRKQEKTATGRKTFSATNHPIELRRFPSEKTMNKKRRGFSPIISTVILTSTILILVLTTSFFANDVLTSQVENAEFEVTIDVMLALNNMIKEVLYKPSSSRYVKTGFQTTSPHLLHTGDTISVWAQVEGEPVEYLIEASPIHLIKIQGGASVKDASKDLVGTSSVLVTDFSSLGHLYVQRAPRAQLLLDFARVRSVRTGMLNLTQEYNVLEVVFVNVTTGSIRLNDRAVFMIRNAGITISQHAIEGAFTLGVDDTRGYHDTVSYSDLPYPVTLVNLMVINVEVSIIGGV